MSLTPSDSSDRSRALRLWPGLVAVALQWLMWVAVPTLVPEQGGTAVIGAFACGLAVVVW